MVPRLVVFLSSAHRDMQLSVSVIFLPNTDIPTSQSVLKQSYTEKTNGKSNDDKVQKPILGSHSIFVTVAISSRTFVLQILKLRLP